MRGLTHRESVTVLKVNINLIKKNYFDNLPTFVSVTSHRSRHGIDSIRVGENFK